VLQYKGVSFQATPSPASISLAGLSSACLLGTGGVGETADRRPAVLVE
jgi:hypothetical protein